MQPQSKSHIMSSKKERSKKHHIQLENIKDSSTIDIINGSNHVTAIHVNKSRQICPSPFSPATILLLPHQNLSRLLQIFPAPSPTQ